VEGAGAERAPHESISGPVIIISPTADIGVALRESVGAAHAPLPLRVAAFTRQKEKLERSLRAASFATRTGSTYTPLVDRAWRGAPAPECSANTVEIELIEAPQADWFPYNSRRGLKL
jgi:hypothetical protein